MTIARVVNRLYSDMVTGYTGHRLYFKTSALFKSPHVKDTDTKSWSRCGLRDGDSGGVHQCILPDVAGVPRAHFGADRCPLKHNGWRCTLHEATPCVRGLLSMVRWTLPICGAIPEEIRIITGNTEVHAYKDKAWDFSRHDRIGACKNNSRHAADQE